MVNEGDVLALHVREERAAVAALRFDYPDGAARDLEAEWRARYLLESLGVLEIACLDQVSVCPGSTADYIIRADSNIHALCSFTAYAVPQLRALGWRVDLPADYPYQVVAADAPWYAHVADDEQPGWFNLELGIEVDGRRVNLLPALLDLLQSMPASARLERLAVPGGRSFALPVGENQYVTVPPERLRILMQVLGELYQGDGGGGALPGHARRLAGPARRRLRRSRGLRRSPRAGLVGRDRARPIAGGRWPARRLRARCPAVCAPRCARTRRTACAGCSTCARTARAACSPTTWGSARRCRRSPTSSPRRRPGASTRRR